MPACTAVHHASPTDAAKKNKKCQFSGPYTWPPPNILRLKYPWGILKLRWKFGDDHSSHCQVIIEHTDIIHTNCSTYIHNWQNLLLLSLTTAIRDSGPSSIQGAKSLHPKLDLGLFSRGAWQTNRLTHHATRSSIAIGRIIHCDSEKMWQSVTTANRKRFLSSLLWLFYRKQILMQMWQNSS